MKKLEKKLKIALYVLIILLIALISFGGVYTKNLVCYDSVLPEFKLSTELTGSRIASFKVSDEEEEKIYDKDGNEVDEIPEGANEEEYKKENVKINPNESLTTENYKKAKRIIEGRFKTLGISDYNIRLDEQNGNILIEIVDNMNTDTVLRYPLYKGDFSMVDSETKEVLMDKSDIEKASILYGNSGLGSLNVYFTIKFNSEGTKKLSEISKNYLGEMDTETGEEDETKPKVSLLIEGTEVISTYFSEEIDTGELTLTIGSGANGETLYNYMSQGQLYEMLLNNEEMPLTYELESSEYMTSSLGANAIYKIIIVMAVICAVIIIYMIIRYKKNGLVTSLSFIVGIAILLLLIRYTGTTISLGGIVAMFILIALDTYFMITILNSIKKDNSYENVVNTTFKTYLKKLDVIIIFLIIGIVFTFMAQLPIYSIGMVLFYGLISFMVANLVFMRNMLITINK